MKTTDQMVAESMRVARLQERALRNPTKENWVLHAVARWQCGCTNGPPGECRECTESFLEALSRHLGVTVTVARSTVDPPRFAPADDFIGNKPPLSWEEVTAPSFKPAPAETWIVWWMDKTGNGHCDSFFTEKMAVSWADHQRSKGALNVHVTAGRRP